MDMSNRVGTCSAKIRAPDLSSETTVMASPRTEPTG